MSTKKLSFADHNQLAKDAKLIRLLLGLCFTLGGIIICFMVLTMYLLPLKRDVPFLVKINPHSNQIVRIEPIPTDADGVELLTESLCKNYVYERELFDLQTEKVRFERITKFGSNEVNEQFTGLVTGDNSPYKERHEAQMTRSVEILSCVQMSKKHDDVYQVEWRSQDVVNGKVVATSNWVSYLTVSYDATVVEYSNRHVNPTGFQVTKYKVIKRDNLNG